MEEVLGAGLAGIVLATAQLSLVRGKMAHLEKTDSPEETAENDGATDVSKIDGWAPARTPETADAPEWEFCGYDACRHHVNSHDYGRRTGHTSPCTECPEGLCVR